MTDMYQNIVALFSKALHMNLKELPDNIIQFGPNQIVLGYFDTLQFYPLKLDRGADADWIHNIWQENLEISKKLKGQFYYHPLHLVADFAEESQESGEFLEQVTQRYKEFWEADSRFTFLSLVQASPLGAAADLRASIREELKKLETANHDGGPSIRYVCYHTMELSDLALIWKADHIGDILTLLQRLYQIDSFGDLNTFPSVNHRCVENPSPAHFSNPPLLHISMQYAVKDFSQADLYFNDMIKVNPNLLHFVAGIDDLQITVEETEDWLLTLLYKSFVEESGATAFHKAFYDSTIQIGIRYKLPSKTLPEDLGAEAEAKGGEHDSVNKDGSLLLTVQCEKLLTECQKFFALDQRPSWHKATLNLLNAMTDMSRSWVMDGFCYLTLGVAQSFCDWISCIHRNEFENKSGPEDNATSKDAIMRSQTELIQKFVRGWGDLMDRATKTDGRYLQMPGFSPILSEIPSRLLEFYLAFTKSCIRTTQQAGGGPDNISLMLVPKICRRIKVYSIFKNIHSEIRAHSDEAGRLLANNHLLYVDIPLSMLYDPKYVMCCLCHEQAHFYPA